MAYTSTYLDTPIRLLGDRSDWITVTDPSHPLYPRSFALAAMADPAGPGRQVLVKYCENVFLKIAAVSTDLYPAPPNLVLSKLSLNAVRDLVCQTKRLGLIGHLTSTCYPAADYINHDSESDLAESNGSQEGEP